jgi:hypothetical protein
LPERLQLITSYLPLTAAIETGATFVPNQWPQHFVGNLCLLLSVAAIAFWIALALTRKRFSTNENKRATFSVFSTFYFLNHDHSKVGIIGAGTNAATALRKHAPSPAFPWSWWTSPEAAVAKGIATRKFLAAWTACSKRENQQRPAQSGGLGQNPRQHPTARGLEAVPT